MTRLDNLPAAAARTRLPAQAREAALRPERTGFAVPEMPGGTAARRIQRHDEATGRSRDVSERARSDRSHAPEASERPRDRGAVERSRSAHRAGDARERREDRPVEADRRADEPKAPGPDKDGRTTDGAQEKVGASASEPTTQDVAATAEAETPAADGDAAQAASTQPGPFGLPVPALALPVPGAPGLGGPGAGLPGETKAPASGSGTVAGVRGSGQGPGRAAKAGETDAPKGSVNPEGDAEHKPAIPVVAAALGRRQGAEDGDGGGAKDAALSGLIEGVTDGPASQSGGTAVPAFADLPGQPADMAPKSGAIAQRAVVTDVALGRVPIEIGLKALDGTNQFEIRLRPEELGRVDVRLDIDGTGQVKAHLTVERPEALALLTRDRGHLEQALEQAGLRPADGGISFSLRDGTTDGGGRFMQGGDGREGDGRSRPGVPDEIGAGTAAVLPRAILSRLGALDMRI